MDHPDTSILGLADEHRALGGHAAPSGAIELKAAAFVLDDVVLADDALLLEAENVVIPAPAIPHAVMIDRAGRHDRKARIVLRQVLLARVRIGRSIVARASRRIFLISRSCCVP